MNLQPQNLALLVGVLGVLIPLLVGALSALITNLFTKRLEDKRRQHEADIQESIFRQQRRDALMDTLAQFQSEMFSHIIKSSTFKDAYRLGTKVQLLAGPDDEDYSALEKVMEEFGGEIADTPPELRALDKKFVRCCHKILERIQPEDKACSKAAKR